MSLFGEPLGVSMPTKTQSSSNGANPSIDVERLRRAGDLCAMSTVASSARSRTQDGKMQMLSRALVGVRWLTQRSRGRRGWRFRFGI